MAVRLVKGDDAVSLKEKRTLAARPALPAWSSKSIRAYPPAFEAYLQDQFGLREELMGVYTRAKFWMGDSPSQKVMRGKDNWLFLKGPSHSSPIRDYQNLDLFSETEMKRYAAYIVAKHRLLEKHKVKYLYFVAPNKHTLFMEKCCLQG